MASYTDVPSFSSTPSPFKERTGLALQCCLSHHSPRPASTWTLIFITASPVLPGAPVASSQSLSLWSAVPDWPWEAAAAWWQPGLSLWTISSPSPSAPITPDSKHYILLITITILISIFKAWSVWHVADVELISQIITVWIMEWIESWKFQHQQPIKYWHLFSSTN